MGDKDCADLYVLCDNTWENIASLISSNDLNVKREEDVYLAVIEWVKQDPTERAQYFPQLLDHVHLPRMSISFLMKEVDSTSNSALMCPPWYAIDS